MEKPSLTCAYANWVMIFWTAFGECCRHCVETRGLSIGSGVTWWPKAEERRGIPSSKSVDLGNLWVNLWKWKALNLKYMGLSRCRCSGQHGCATWHWYLCHVALDMATSVEALDVAWKKKILPVFTEHISPWREKVKNAWSFDFIVLCAFITIRQHWWLLSLFENYRNVFIAVVPQSGAACVRFWRRRQSGDAKYWKFMLCFVFSQLGAGQGNTWPCLWSNVMSPWGIRYPTKVSFKNTFSFCCVYIHCTWPPQESKVQASRCQLASQ